MKNKSNTLDSTDNFTMSRKMSTKADKSRSERSGSKTSEESGKPKEPQEMVSLMEIYRYATWVDYVLIVIGIVFGMTQGALNSVSSIIFKGLTDALVKGQFQWDAGVFDYDAFYHSAMKAIYEYVGYGMGIFTLAFISMSCWHTVCERQIHQIRKRYFAAVLRQNMGWFDSNETGKLTTKMSDGIDRIKDGIGDKMGILFTFSANFVGGMAVAFSCSWKMTLVMLAFVPVLAGLIGLLTRIVGQSVRKEMRAYEKAGAIADEVVTGIRTVIAFNGQTKEIDRYEGRLQEAANFGIKKAFYLAFGTAWIFCLIFVAMGVAFWYGTKLFIGGEISAGTVFATFWAVMGGTVAIGQAAPQIGVIMGARSAASSIFKVIDRTPEIDCRSSEGSTIDSPKGNIEFKGIHFRYPTRPDEKVLDDVSFKVSAGQSVALVGHSGCGKSTLIGLLLRFYDQEQGQVTFDGVPLNEMNIRWLRRTIGVVSQEPVLFAATIEENLKLGNEEMTMEDMERVCRLANAHEFIKDLPDGYKTHVGEGGVQLSGGQKQRIAIARALARDPKVLLLDEATSALDSESEQIVQHALDNASAGRTTLTIAHRLSTIRNSDRIIVFDHGRIVETGTHSELMALGGTYMQLVRAQEIEKANEEEELKIEADQEEELNLGHKRPFRQISRTSSASVRMSRRLGRAISNASAADKAVEELREELEEEKKEPSGMVEIVRFARKEWPMLIVALIASIIKGLTFPLFSIIYGAMFKSLSKPTADEKMAGARINAVYFAILGVGAGISTFVGGFLFARAGECLTKRLRLALFSNIIKQDGEYFDSLEHASGKLTTRLATDAPNIRAAIDQRLADVLQSLSAIVSGIAIAFSYGPKMAPIGIVTSVCLISAQTLIAQYLKKRSQGDTLMAQEPSRLATEAIASHKTVQYLTREQHFYDEFNRLMRRPHRRALTRGLIQAFTFALHVCFIFINFACAYRFGVWLVKTRNSSPYTVFQVIEALNCASMSLLAFGTYFPEYVRARLSAGLVFSMLREQPKIDSLCEGGKKVDLEGDVTMDHLYFAYPTNPKRLVLKGFNLHVPKGKTVALVGPSGCGKSTTIQLLERLYDPLDGRMMFDGTDCRERNVAHLRSQIALVGQEPILFNYSIRENIAYGLQEASAQDIEEAARLANAHNFIMEMSEGYETGVGEKGGKLSGGQKQRIAIARAIIRKPKILLLDEATSALDSESEKIVQEALDRARNGRTCIVIAHRLSSIQNSDLIVVMKEGRMIEVGNHQQLLHQEGLYARLIKKQNLE